MYEARLYNLAQDVSETMLTLQVLDMTKLQPMPPSSQSLNLGSDAAQIKFMWIISLSSAVSRKIRGFWSNNHIMSRFIVQWIKNTGEFVQTFFLKLLQALKALEQVILIYPNLQDVHCYIYNNKFRLFITNIFYIVPISSWK